MFEKFFQKTNSTTTNIPEKQETIATESPVITKEETVTQEKATIEETTPKKETSPIEEATPIEANVSTSTSFSESQVKEDLQAILKALENLKGGNYDSIDEITFHDPAVKAAIDDYQSSLAKKNNHFLARINDAQRRIGDTSCLRSMFELISSQQGALDMLMEVRGSVDLGETSMEEINQEFLMLSEQLRQAFPALIEEIAETHNLLSNIFTLCNITEIDETDPFGNGDLPQPEITDGEALSRALREMNAKLSTSSKRVMSMGRRISDMSSDVRTLFGIIDKKNSLNNAFLESVDSITDSYKQLSMECLHTGRHLYRISRDIDNARNDLYRNNSRPTIHDRLQVFEVDHLTLTWRLYNNIVEYESLRITQLNNPTSCKFGLWAQSEKDPAITDSDEFKALIAAHNNLHEKAVACFTAKQDYNVDLALSLFDESLVAMGQFTTAMDAMHEYLRSIGHTEETDIWKFRG